MDIADILSKLGNYNKRLKALESMESVFPITAILATDQPQAIPATTYTKINYNLISDPHNCVVDSGIYFRKYREVQVIMIAQTIDTTWKNKDYFELAILVDGLFHSVIAREVFRFVSTTFAFASGVTVLQMQAGENLEFAVWSSVATTLSGVAIENKVIPSKHG